MAFTSAKSDGSSRHSEIEHRYEFVAEPAPHRRYMDESELSFKVHNSLFRQLFARLFVYVYALYMTSLCRSNEATRAWICSEPWTSKTCMHGGKYRTNPKLNIRESFLEHYFDFSKVLLLISVLGLQTISYHILKNTPGGNTLRIISPYFTVVKIRTPCLSHDLVVYAYKSQ